MAQYAETYFTNIGFDSIEDFNLENSIFAKPTKGDGKGGEKTGSKLQCDASAWDFKNKKDFRITICAEPTRNDMQHMIELFGMFYFKPVLAQADILVHSAQPKLIFGQLFLFSESVLFQSIQRTTYFIASSSNPIIRACNRGGIPLISISS